MLQQKLILSVLISLTFFTSAVSLAEARMTIACEEESVDKGEQVIYVFEQQDEVKLGEESPSAHAYEQLFFSNNFFNNTNFSLKKYNGSLGDLVNTAIDLDKIDQIKKLEPVEEPIQAEVPSSGVGKFNFSHPTNNLEVKLNMFRDEIFGSITYLKNGKEVEGIFNCTLPVFHNHTPEQPLRYGTEEDYASEEGSSEYNTF